MHCVTRLSPVVELKVVAGHSVGVEELAGQYEPAGQMLPVTPSVGVALMARKMQ